MPRDGGEGAAIVWQKSMKQLTAISAFAKDELHGLWLVGDARGSLVELESQIEIAMDCRSEATERGAKPSEIARRRNRLRHWSESQAPAPDSRLLR